MTSYVKNSTASQRPPTCYTIFMILGVDIGGTKTLFGVFDASGRIITTERFLTPKNYQEFLKTFTNEYKKIKSGVDRIIVAAPGRINRENSTVIAFGNLPWKNTPLAADIMSITGISAVVENDAKLAALAEARALHNTPDRVLYITFSTGIGAGLVYKGALDSGMLDSEVGQMLLPNPDKNNEMERWESFASGKALYEKYGVRAEDIIDMSIWEAFTKKMSIGIVELCAVIEPDIIIIGGGVGAHFGRYGAQLEGLITKELPPMIKKPRIVGAQKAELASLNGCYEYGIVGSST